MQNISGTDQNTTHWRSCHETGCVNVVQKVDQSRGGGGEAGSNLPWKPTTESPIREAIHISSESTSAPTKQNPGGACTSALISLPRRSGSALLAVSHSGSTARLDMVPAAITCGNIAPYLRPQGTVPFLSALKQCTEETKIYKSMVEDLNSFQF